MATQNVMERIFGARKYNSLPTASQQPVAAEPEKPAIEVAPYGERFGNLTRFGNVWLPLNDLAGINGLPDDGCGAEVYVKGIPEPFHLSDEESAALAQYMAASNVAG